MTKTLRLKLLLLLNITCIGNGIVYGQQSADIQHSYNAVSYTHLRAHET